MAFCRFQCGRDEGPRSWILSRMYSTGNGASGRPGTPVRDLAADETSPSTPGRASATRPESPKAPMGHCGSPTPGQHDRADHQIRDEGVQRYRPRHQRCLRALHPARTERCGSPTTAAPPSARSQSRSAPDHQVRLDRRTKVHPRRQRPQPAGATKFALYGSPLSISPIRPRLRTDLRRPPH